MRDIKQVYQNPEIEVHHFAFEDVVTSSGENLTWNNGWTGDGWDNPDDTYIGE